MRVTITVVLVALAATSLQNGAKAEWPATEQVIEKAQFLAPEPALTSSPESISSVTPLFEAPEVGCTGRCGSVSTCDPCCSTATCASCCPDCCHGPCVGCTMGQHHAYFPPLHGYYYFRPYNYSHVRQQQIMVRSWGGNPAHPYANELFQAVYKQGRSEIGTETTR